MINKTIQIIRFVMAELFTAISVLLFYKAGTEENLYWVITLGVFGVITAFIAVVAIILFIQEYKKGFTFIYRKIKEE